MLRLDCHVIFIFCLHRAIYKHVEAVCLWINRCSWKNKEREKVLCMNKKNDIKRKKNRPKEERKSTILSRNENNSFVKATGTGGAPRWRQDFDRRSRWPKFSINNVKNEVFFSSCKYQP